MARRGEEHFLEDANSTAIIGRGPMISLSADLNSSICAALIHLDTRQAAQLWSKVGCGATGILRGKAFASRSLIVSNQRSTLMPHVLQIARA